MTSTETIQRMESKNILKHWILPEQGLNKGTRYEKAPHGNASELNALDSNCNWDIHCAVLMHAALTLHMEKISKRKYSLDSPKHQDNAYMHLWNPALQ
eukprot:3831612-Ditylum_brightwellii.AAC.1